MFCARTRSKTHVKHNFGFAIIIHTLTFETNKNFSEQGATPFTCRIVYASVGHWSRILLENLTACTLSSEKDPKGPNPGIPRYFFLEGPTWLPKEWYMMAF